MKIRATLPGEKGADGKRTVKASHEVEYDFGSNLKEAVAKFGDDKVYKAALNSFVISIQNTMRSLLEAGIEDGKTQAVIAKEITATIEEWEPTERKRGKTAKEKLRDQLAAMSDEDRKALLRELSGGGKK